MRKENETDRIQEFVKNYLKSDNFSIEPITNSASERKYFRVKTLENSIILTFSSHIAENKTFLYFSKIFKDNNVPVPSILNIDRDNEMYLQEDMGDFSLLEVLLHNGEDTTSENLYKKSLKHLLNLQFNISDKIDYSKCFDFKSFNKDIINNDLNYFKFYFFQPLEIPYSNSDLLKEFMQIGETIESMEPRGFMFRDFQARNIIVKNNEPYFIDYQGGMLGNPFYDLVSLLWQAKAQLSENFKENLKNYYFSEVRKVHSITDKSMEISYQYCLLIRLLQVLGAYGFRGILQKKKHFKESLILGINNLKILHKESLILHKYPELKRIIQILISNKTEIKINQIIK
ncbi:phosphotransferase [Apibacter raozihei]|uniref:aminoglycoside phosphotransferase family protein n=1 Tax=Apibacter raozihei TaxID=2500547 RepID=UPI000FE2D079|nr:phosphotransferase [Apibacter raozihei]